MLLHGGERPEAFHADWPPGVPLQVHTTEHDPWVELDAAEELVRSVDGAQLYRYPGSAHLFTDAGTDEHDAQATELVLERMLSLLERVRDS